MQPTATQTQAPPSPLLTRPDSAAYLAVSQRKVDGLVAAGELRVVRIGTCVRIPLAELDAYIAERTR